MPGMQGIGANGWRPAHMQAPGPSLPQAQAQGHASWRPAGAGIDDGTRPTLAQELALLHVFGDASAPLVEVLGEQYRLPVVSDGYGRTFIQGTRLQPCDMPATAFAPWPPRLVLDCPEPLVLPVPAGVPEHAHDGTPLGQAQQAALAGMLACEPRTVVQRIDFPDGSRHIGWVMRPQDAAGRRDAVAWLDVAVSARGELLSCTVTLGCDPHRPLVSARFTHPPTTCAAHTPGPPPGADDRAPAPGPASAFDTPPSIATDRVRHLMTRGCNWRKLYALWQQYTPRVTRHQLIQRLIELFAVEARAGRSSWANEVRGIQQATIDVSPTSRNLIVLMRVVSGEVLDIRLATNPAEVDHVRDWMEEAAGKVDGARMRNRLPEEVPRAANATSPVRASESSALDRLSPESLSALSALHVRWRERRPQGSLRDLAQLINDRFADLQARDQVEVVDAALALRCALLRDIDGVAQPILVMSDALGVREFRAVAPDAPDATLDRARLEMWWARMNAGPQPEAGPETHLSAAALAEHTTEPTPESVFSTDLEIPSQRVNRFFGRHSGIKLRELQGDWELVLGYAVTQTGMVRRMNKLFGEAARAGRASSTELRNVFKASIPFPLADSRLTLLVRVQGRQLADLQVLGEDSESGTREVLRRISDSEYIAQATTAARRGAKSHRALPASRADPHADA